MGLEFFDLIIIVPLEEELHHVLEQFEFLEDRSTSTQLRYIVTSSVSYLRILVVQQEDMGRGQALSTASSILDTYDAGLLVCLGIAGSLSTDMRLGDVCYSGTIIDVYDNARASDSDSGDVNFEFSPEHYFTERQITAALNFIRTHPDLKPKYRDWEQERLSFVNAQVSGPVTGRDGKDETIGVPRTKNGTIACGSVSKSDAYNKKLLAIDRRILVIETESGGVFAEARSRGIPALTIRGTSDYADRRKGKL